MRDQVARRTALCLRALLGLVALHSSGCSPVTLPVEARAKPMTNHINGVQTVQIFTVFDRKAITYMQPFFTHNSATAMRELSIACQNPKHPFRMHPEDYVLFHVGEFDDATGQIDNAMPITICDMLTIVDQLGPDAYRDPDGTPRAIDPNYVPQAIDEKTEEMLEGISNR